MHSAEPKRTPFNARTGYWSLRELVQGQLTEDIQGARLRPGQKLVETELAQLYGVSRGPVREAIRALEGQGLVQFVSNRGAVVSSLTPDDVQEIYAIRVELDGLAAHLATPLISDDQTAILGSLVERMDAAQQEGATKTFVSLNDQFHLRLYCASGRLRLCNLIEDLMGTVLPYALLYVTLPDRLADTHADHRLILEAVRAGDADQAEALTQEHLRRSAKLIVELVRDGTSAMAAGIEGPLRNPD